MVEISMRLYVDRLPFFNQFWNVFDLALVVADFMGTVLEGLLDLGSMPSVAFLRVLRIGRVLRIFKVCQEFPELTMLISGMWSATKAIFWAAIMIFVVLMMW